MKLRVTEAKTKDVGRGIARIDPDYMEQLKVAVGDIVEITGARKTYAKVMPSFVRLFAPTPMRRPARRRLSFVFQSRAKNGSTMCADAAGGGCVGGSTWKRASAELSCSQRLAATASSP